MKNKKKKNKKNKKKNLRDAHKYNPPPHTPAHSSTD
jgi:hypothetical protein